MTKIIIDKTYESTYPYIVRDDFELIWKHLKLLQNPALFGPIPGKLTIKVEYNNGEV